MVVLSESNTVLGWREDAPTSKLTALQVVARLDTIFPGYTFLIDEHDIRWNGRPISETKVSIYGEDLRHKFTATILNSWVEDYLDGMDDHPFPLLKLHVGDTTGIGFKADNSGWIRMNYSDNALKELVFEILIGLNQMMDKFHGNNQRQ